MKSPGNILYEEFYSHVGGEEYTVPEYSYASLDEDATAFWEGIADCLLTRVEEQYGFEAESNGQIAALQAVQSHILVRLTSLESELQALGDWIKEH